MAYPSETAERFQIRLPDGMRDQIAAAAKENGRSMNAEIIARLSGDTETLRDKFAGQALVGLKDLVRDDCGWNPDDYAKDAFALADAMLAARKGGAA